jgi:hypothetical protein
VRVPLFVLGLDAAQWVVSSTLCIVLATTLHRGVALAKSVSTLALLVLLLVPLVDLLHKVLIVILNRVVAASDRSQRV